MKWNLSANYFSAKAYLLAERLKWQRSSDRHSSKAVRSCCIKRKVNGIFLPTIFLPKLVFRDFVSQNVSVNLRGKIITWEHLPTWRAALRSAGKRLVVTNGCFDLLHPGHVFYLEAARNLGDALLIGLNGDASVGQLKGPGRPVNHQDDRAIVLAALESVSCVCIFQERAATRFLSRAEPDIYVKGGDYTLETLNQEERRLVEQNGGKIEIIPFTPGKSTTALLKKISAL